MNTDILSEIKGQIVRNVLFVAKSAKRRGKDMKECSNYTQGSNGKEKCFWFWIAGEVCAKGAFWKECPYQKKISKPSPASSDFSQSDKNTSRGA